MARPLSEEKRLAILEASVCLFAKEGLNASTSKIAKQAKVSEGSIFTYFATKDELMNQLYLELKIRLGFSLATMPESVELKERMWLIWQSYITWGVNHPDEQKVLAKLAMASNITEETKAAAHQTFCESACLLEQAMALGSLKGKPIEFVGALLGAMGDVTMTFIRNNPSSSEGICRDGFIAFWNAVTGT